MSHLTVQQISSSLDGAVTGPSLEVIVRHLANCPECRDRQSRLARHDDVLRRLLAPEPSEEFLETLGTRGEEIAVSIARGMPPPEMTTTVPLLHEEDPQTASEPPLPERPELGRGGQIAKDAGYGRIGLKPTAAAQPPESDPEEAQRWLEALEHGAPDDPTPFTANPPEKSAPDGPVFDLPAWLQERASSPSRPMPRIPREVQKLKLVFDSEPSKPEREKAEREKAEREKAEREKAERVERENAERERAERETAEREEAERVRAEREQIEREKAEREEAERVRAERERLERERAEREEAERVRAERERIERETAEREEAERVRAERERIERETAEREEAERVRAEREEIERETAERERAERERVERESAERERVERLRAEREKAEREKAEREEAERERARAEREKAEREEAERVRAERVRAERERAEREEAERVRAERVRAEREKAEREEAERQRIERARAEREKAEREEAERQRVERARAEREQAEREKTERERAERARAEREEAEHEEAERERVERVRAEWEMAARKGPEREKPAREWHEEEEEPMPRTPRGSADEPYRGSTPYEPRTPHPEYGYEPVPTYESASGAYDDGVDEELFAYGESTGYATRAQAQAVHERRLREARARGTRPFWFLAGGSVGALLIVVLVMQLVPSGPGAHQTVAGGFRLPRVEFVRRDSTTTAPGTPTPEVRSASTPAPVETVVPPTPREAAPTDSNAVEAPKDSTNGAPGR